MRVELFNYGRYRYMLCGPSDLSPGERYETELDALAAGAKLFAIGTKDIGRLNLKSWPGFEHSSRNRFRGIYRECGKIIRVKS